MSKRRSGLKNDQRAYYCCPHPRPQICNPITISLTDIATLSVDGTSYYLNGDTTIQSCEILEFEYGIELVIYPYKLINRGKINNIGIINNVSNSNGIINKGIINQNGFGCILNSNGGIIDNTGGTIDNTSCFINNTNGTIYLGDGSCGTIGTIITNDGSIFLGNLPSYTCP